MGNFPSYLNSKRKEMMEFLLTLDATRGTDGTGVYSADIMEERVLRDVVVKNVGNVFNLIESRAWDRHMFDGDLMLGHNRATSTGVSNQSNAHPHDMGSIVGVHNGTISGWSSHPERYSYDVDSQYLLDKIAKNGADKAIPEITGSYSLVWFDRKEGTLNFLRNKERPMKMCSVKDGGIVFASEEWMLKAFCAKFYIEYVPMTLLEDTHYIFALDKDDKVIEIDHYPLKGKEVKTYQTGTYNVKKSRGGSSYGMTCYGCGRTNLHPQEIADKYMAGNEWYYCCKQCAQEWGMHY